MGKRKSLKGSASKTPHLRIMVPVLQDLTGIIGERGAGRQGKRAPLEEAKEVIYSAGETGNRARRVALAKQALQISPDCADAYVLLAEDDAAATWAYSRALLAFRESGDGNVARKALRAAREMNPHVPAFLSGERKLPKVFPETIGFGDESEAVEYAAEGLKGWQQTLGALEWLATMATEECRSSPPGRKEASP